MSADSEARFVVAVDFGTTFSGFAYAKRSEPDKVFTYYDWPCYSKAGAKPYCKTLTALYYAPQQDKPGTFTLQDWGWSAFLKYTEATRRRPKTDSPLDRSAVKNSLQQTDTADGSSQKPGDLLMLPENWHGTRGFFATKFKLYLAKDAPQLPGDITVERMIVDFLKALSDFIMADLQQKYGKHVTIQDVQWCLTVPAIWYENSKQQMKLYAEKAGMVSGPNCPDPSNASHCPLGITLEPEAASVYCQFNVKHLHLRKGDKILIADVGGGTVDFVAHEKSNDDAQSMQVDEVVGSYGELGGGTFVDNHFFEWASRKIGCLKSFCASNPAFAIRLHEWWQNIKLGFDGDGYSAELSLPRKLSEAWEEYDAENGAGILHDDNYYDELQLEDFDIKEIFDKEVGKILRLIQKQIHGVRVLMLVGGFSASQYLRMCVKEMFGSLVEEIITPQNPGSAICHGAVQLHMDINIVQSRIAKRTYGLAFSRDAISSDPEELCFIDDDDGVKKCHSVFAVFVRVGDRVPLNQSITRVYSPGRYGQERISVSVYTSPNACPMYTTDPEVKEEGSFDVDISEDMELDREREVEVKMYFGASLINVTAQRLNFGDPDSLKGLTVSFSGN